jgi:hypothetical protein
MREISNAKLRARVSIDEHDRVRQINHSEAPWTTGENSPVRAALEYLRQTAAELQITEEELGGATQAVSFSEPREQGVEYRLGKEKSLFDSATIIFNQTYLNVPVWRAAITVTLKQNPNRVLLVTDTSERGMDARLPSRERIDAHRRIFALAAAGQQLRTLGLADQARAAAIADEDAQPKTADFIRQILGREVTGNANREAGEDDDARAIRGRFFVYRYEAAQRLPEARPEGENAGGANLETSEHQMPLLALPAVDPSIESGAWRLVSEVTFAFTTPEHGRLNWRALVDVQTDAILLIEPLVAGLNGLVFHRDPITSTGNGGNTPDLGDAALNPLRTSVPLSNLDAPSGGRQALRGRFAMIADVLPPTSRGRRNRRTPTSTTTSARATLRRSTRITTSTASSDSSRASASRLPSISAIPPSLFAWITAARAAPAFPTARSMRAASATGPTASSTRAMG